MKKINGIHHIVSNKKSNYHKFPSRKMKKLFNYFNKCRYESWKVPPRMYVRINIKKWEFSIKSLFLIPHNFHNSFYAESWNLKQTFVWFFLLLNILFSFLIFLLLVPLPDFWFSLIIRDDENWKLKSWQIKGNEQEIVFLSTFNFFRLC